MVKVDSGYDEEEPEIRGDMELMSDITNEIKNAADVCDHFIIRNAGKSNVD